MSGEWTPISRECVEINYRAIARIIWPAPWWARTAGKALALAALYTAWRHA